METTTRSESNKVQNQNLEAYGFLEVISGQFDNRGVIIPYQIIPITKCLTQIGRQYDLPIRITDTRISALHATLVIDSNQKVWITNKSKTNSVSINGIIIQPEQPNCLCNDDVVELSKAIKLKWIKVCELSNDTKEKGNGIVPKAWSFQGVQVTARDIMMLQYGRFFNDIIIECGIKSIIHDCVPEDVLSKVHFFSSFFYERIQATFKEVCKNNRLMHFSALERFAKNVNIFEKEFIFIPINQNLHWILAVVCFPCLLVESELKTELVSLTIRSPKADQTVPDSALESSNTKKPCILIFDSLGDKDQETRFANIRKYLAIELKRKHGQVKIFDESTVPGIVPSVPLQPNNFDCGPFVLFYLKQFFQNPIQKFCPSLENCMAANWSDSSWEDTRQNLYDQFKTYLIEQNQDVFGFPVVTHFKEIKESNLSLNDGNVSKVSQQTKLGTQPRSISPDITGVQTMKIKGNKKKLAKIVSHVNSPKVPCKRTKAAF